MDTDRILFPGKVVIVTGSGTGLGRSHALQFASRGAAVVVNDLNADAADSVVAEIIAAGGNAVLSAASVATQDGAQQIVDTALGQLGGLDVLVNNAGILNSFPFGEFAVDDWDRAIAVNLKGTFLMSRAAWRHFETKGGGRIVNTSSNSGLLGIPGSAAYASAKAGVWGLTRVLALEGKDLGIAVNAIAPIAFTAMSKQSKNVPKSWLDGTGDAWSRRLDVGVVSPVVLWLAHPSCPLNGEILSAAGGRVARFFMGLGEGWDTEALTPELVREHAEEILDIGQYQVLSRAFDEGRMLHRRLLGK